LTDGDDFSAACFFAPDSPAGVDGEASRLVLDFLRFVVVSFFRPARADAAFFEIRRPAVAFFLVLPPREDARPPADERDDVRRAAAFFFFFRPELFFLPDVFLRPEDLLRLEARLRRRPLEAPVRPADRFLVLFLRGFLAATASPLVADLRKSVPAKYLR